MTPPDRRRVSLRLARIAAALFLAVGSVIAWRLHASQPDWSSESLRAWIADWPYAPLVFVAVIVFRPFLLLPSAVVMTAGGVLFGIWQGAVLGAIGGAISGLMTFCLARGLGREFAERRFGPRLRAADAYVADRGPGIVAALTAFPATPLTALQLAFGLSGVAALPFTAATLIGMLPRTLLLAWFGDSLAQSQWREAMLAFALMLVLVGVGLRLRKRLQATPRDSRIAG